MLVWVLFEKAYAGSTFIAYQQPGCAKGPVVDVDVDGDACGCYAIPSDYPDGHACGCYALTSDYRGGYNFDYQIQGIALYNTAGCAGKPDAVMFNSQRDCNPFGWNSVYFFCT
ncbi:hypothetical protein SUGI_1495770 [Cryptomeria japonica]|uniref:Uncharacterized protein n=1 Tax=Cryptomeria japonica TaxID=3369 RepID=A0AAD3NNT0_CRYJA|nr:hypothetical protein SUGI_0551270 [Cryptomeria japonica]GLJ28076.1 hypothetical protein SUGI_0551280 [Cryptomeria japonica]GLJ59165.1 hypothetical protein SUGI_1495770 [Cryptomeria japonica]